SGAILNYTTKFSTKLGVFVAIASRNRLFTYPISPPHVFALLPLQLSKIEKPISREELRQRLTQKLNLSSVDFNNGLQSLQQRYLVVKIKEDKVMFSLSPVFREYVINYCKD
ncbi:hypothetical protein, partial [Sphaerospermopsis reniformis]|uniref:hypothetical protein n=1 Tax=Sphaerospermopsis reniformis TaxID=531300 RepID=UPI001F29F859